MKKITILMASILAMVGCAKNADFDNVNSRNRVEMTVSAAQEATEISRVAFNGAVTDMIWEANDKIGVHIASTGENATFTVSELSDDNESAIFRAVIDEPAAIDNYYAFYPATTPVSGTNVTFELPAETTGAGAPYLVASCEEAAMSEVALTFKPATALLQLTLGFAADKVVVESNNGEYISGQMVYNLASKEASIATGSNSVALTSPAAGTHFLYMPEVTLANGYKVIVTCGDKQMVKSVSYGKEKKFVAGEITSLTISDFEAVSVSLCDVVTSYTLYTRGDSAANSTDAHTIAFNGNCSFSGISATLVDECGVYYGSTKVVGTKSGKTFSLESVGNVTKGSYEVYAYVRANGVTYKSASTTIHITGLPFSQSLSGANPTGWSCSNTVDQDGFMFKYSEAYAISPAFHIPANVNVTATFSAHAYKPISYKSYTPSFYISASESDSKATLAKSSMSSDINLPGATASFSNISATVTLSPSVQKICAHVSGSGHSNSFLVKKDCGVHAKTCTINYTF